MRKYIRRTVQFFMAVLFISSGFLGMRQLMASRPIPEQNRPAVAVPGVRTVRLSAAPVPVIIKGEGIVQPLREMTLIPQVSGKAIYVSPALLNGGRFSKGEILVRIEPADYRIAVTLAEAKIRDSESRLKQIQEESDAAREEWMIHYANGSKKNKKPSPLALKKPQLAAAESRLEADRADYKKAILNLRRTRLEAPFSGRTVQKNVDAGQYVTPGQSLARLFCTEAAEIVVTLENDDLAWFHVPGFSPGTGRGARAVVKARIAGQDLTLEGEVMRAEGKLDERTRMIHVVVRVKNPYATRPPLAMGLFVTVHISGKTLEQAVSIPRSALRQGNGAPDHLVWVLDNGRLKFRRVEVARIDGERALISSGLRDGEEIILSPLKAVSNNMAVQSIPDREKRS